MMKRFCRALALLLALALCLGVAAAEEEKVYTTDNPKMINAVFADGTDWYGTEEARGVMTTCTMMDLVLSFDDTFSDCILDAMERDEVYIAQSGIVCSVFFMGSKGWICTFCVPGFADFRGYYTPSNIPLQGSVLLSALQSNGTVDSYYKIPASYVWELYAAIMEGVGE